MIGLGIFLPVVLEENAKLKECRDCHEFKSLDEFSKDKNKKDNRHTRCKDCHKKKVAERTEKYQNNLIKIDFKECMTCGIVKGIGEFFKLKNSKDGFARHCKDCSLKCDQKVRAKNKEINSRQVIPISYHKVCPTCGIDKHCSEFHKNIVRKDGLMPECRDCSILASKTEKARKTVRDRTRNRRKNDIEFAIYLSEVSRQNKAIKSDKGDKSGRTRVLLGISIKDYITYLKSKFEPGMSMDNKGILWEVDHLIPRTAFNLKLPEHQLIFFNYKNTMPRWKTTRIAKEHGSSQMGNIEKSDKILPEFEYLLAEYGLK